MAIKKLKGAGPHQTGLSLGSSTTDLVSLYGVTGIAQRAGAAQGAVTQTGVAVTDSTGGSTANTTLAAVGATNSGDVSAAINAGLAKLAVIGNANRADIAALTTLANELRAALVALGAIKGAA
jgi:hypothetical protein